MKTTGSLEMAAGRLELLIRPDRTAGAVSGPNAVRWGISLEEQLQLGPKRPLVLVAVELVGPPTDPGIAPPNGLRKDIVKVDRPVR